ncbi:MAG: NADP transhydrogenase subunit alpha, partial [Bacteroidetes bacterium CG12_big_fil_rev_8_21_14_0_65_60_17]
MKICVLGSGNGGCAVAYAGHDIETALSGAKIVYAVGPAYSTRPFAEHSAPHLTDGQIVIVCPGSTGGALEFQKASGIR